MLNTLVKVSLAAALAVAANSAVAADAERGKTLYKNCQLCHGDNGQGSESLKAPKISGLQTWYVERQLQYFKDGIRGTNPKDIYGMQMRPMVMVLKDEKDIADVAAYVGTLKD